MMRSEKPIDLYLAAYGRALARARIGGWFFRQRVLAEAESHLRHLARSLEQNGTATAAAEREAIERFGDPDELTRAWLADPESARGFAGAWRLDWIVCSSLGCLGGLALALAAGQSLGGLLAMFLILPTVGLAVGIGLGLAQWILLRATFDGPPRWILATGIGLSVGLTITTIVVEALSFDRGVLLEEMAALIIIGAGTGGVVALAQRLLVGPLLRSEHGFVERTSAGAGVGTLVGGLVAYAALGGFRSDIGLLIIAFLAALGAAATTTEAFRHLACDARSA